MAKKINERDRKDDLEFFNKKEVGPEIAAKASTIIDGKNITFGLISQNKRRKATVIAREDYRRVALMTWQNGTVTSLQFSKNYDSSVLNAAMQEVMHRCGMEVERIATGAVKDLGAPEA